MKNKLRFLLPALFLLLLSTMAMAQVNDAGLWLSLNAEKKLNPALSLGFSEEFRFNENIAELGSFLSDIGFIYKINTNVKFSANYRFINSRQLDNAYSKRHRYYFDLIIRKKIKPFTFSLRNRFQSQYSDIYSSSDGSVPKNYLREKLLIKFDLDKKITPYFYTELYYNIGNNIDKMRYSAGFEYAINRMHSFDFFYLFQNEINVNNPGRDFVLGMGYSYSF